jgi:hypothetical protein
MSSGSPPEQSRTRCWCWCWCCVAVTIARIVSGNARARERPEVRAKVEAWNRSRTGVRLPEQHKVSSAAPLCGGPTAVSAA